MIFLSFMLLERKTTLEVLMAVCVIIIAAFDLVLGFGDAKKAMASLPWESVSGGGGQKQSAAPAGAQPSSGGNAMAYDANTDSY